MNQFSKVKSRISNPLSFLQTAYATSSGDVSQPSEKQTTPSRSSTTNVLAGTTATKGNHENGQSSAPENPSHPTPPPTINVVLFGETGVGKSSVINLIARREVARVSSDVNGCTMQSIRYDIPFDNMNFAIFDTIGLEEPQIGVNGYLKAIEKAYELILKLGAAGGIHLLLFCMRGGRITATTQSNYRLFHECLCSTKVPIALVFTCLEGEEDMEDWWVRNQDYIRGYGIKSNGHACVTTVHGDTPGEDLKYAESQKNIRELLKRNALQNGAFSPEAHSWFARLGKGLLSFIEKRKSPKRRDVMRVLTNRCKLDTETARKIINMMEKGDAETKGDQVEQGKEGGEGGSHSMEGEEKSGVANGNRAREHTSVTPHGDDEAGPQTQVGRKDGGIPKVIGSGSQGWPDKMQTSGVASMVRPQETISGSHITDSRQPSENGTREHTLATQHRDGPDKVEKKDEEKPRMTGNGSQDVGTIKRGKKQRPGVTSGSVRGTTSRP